jgi:glycosyltransferase involved in cell wall biosynthesis
MNFTSKIAIDLTACSPSRMDGINRYSIELLKALLASPLDNFIAYTSSAEVLNTKDERVKVVATAQMSDNNFQGNMRRFLWHQFQLPLLLKQNKISLIYSAVPEGMLLPICPQVITVHDILPILFPDVYPRLHYYFKHLLPAILKTSTAIISVSASTKKDLQNYYNIPEEKIQIVHPAYSKDVFYIKPEASVDAIKNKYHLNDFILCVGETRPYKNSRKLIQAFANVKLPDLQLAVVGKISKLDRELLQLPAQLNITEKVVFLDGVSDADLADLYRGAKAFIFPSLYEGFGIPPLEAMACGCPVIVSQVASLPEVCGEAAYYINPYSIESIAQGIYQVITDDNLRQNLSFQGLEQVKNFNYQTTAQQIIDIFSRVPIGLTY